MRKTEHKGEMRYWRLRSASATAVVLLVLATAVSVRAALESRPVVLVFDTVIGEGVDKTLAKSATRALCSYLRDTQRVEAIAFDRDSPIVLRAIMDKQLTADQVASYSSQQERIAVAKALAYDYAAGSELSIKDGIVTVRVWLAKVDGGKDERWEASSQASTGGTGERGYDNAMQSATSASVLSIARQAFVKLPAVPDAEPASPSQTTALTSDLPSAPNPPTATDYLGQADASLNAGQLAVAIQQYEQAANADPTNPAIRLKLADAYGRKGMYDQAYAELDRAEKLGASADAIAAARDKLNAMRIGQANPNAAAVKTTTGSQSGDQQPVTTEPIQRSSAEPKSTRASAVAKMKEGDRLWQANQPDEAAEAYKEAIKLDPSDWRAYERLALVDASMSLFGESRAALEQLAKVQPNPSPQTITSRYQLFSKVFEQWFATLFRQLDRDSADYDAKKISRESYYSSVKGLGLRLESMARFLEVLPCPEDKKAANLHRSLACGLVAQAASSLRDYLETNNAESRSNAETFIAQAKKELENVSRLESRQSVSAGQ